MEHSTKSLIFKKNPKSRLGRNSEEKPRYKNKYFCRDTKLFFYFY